MSTDIKTLNASFGIEGKFSVVEGKGGLPLCRLKNDFGEAELYLHGAHLCHWQPVGQDAVLWMSDEAIFEAGKAIRGGVPICWPWFGPHESDDTQPAHGLARILSWDVLEVEDRADGTLKVVLGLESNETTQSYLAADFQLRFTLILAEQLMFSLKTVNNGSQEIHFSEALHTYFSVASSRQVSISGLEDTIYIDKVRDAKRFKQEGPIQFTEETDRVYLNTTSTCVIEDPWAGRQIIVEKSGSASTVVWNPWIAKSERMSDFGDIEYKTMCCVETANASDNTVTLPAGQEHEIAVRLSVR